MEENCPVCDVKLVETISCFLCPECLRDFMSTAQIQSMYNARAYLSTEKIKKEMQSMADMERDSLHRKKERKAMLSEALGKIRKNKAGIFSALVGVCGDRMEALAKLGEDDDGREGDSPSAPPTGGFA